MLSLGLIASRCCLMTGSGSRGLPQAPSGRLFLARTAGVSPLGILPVTYAADSVRDIIARGLGELNAA